MTRKTIKALSSRNALSPARADVVENRLLAGLASRDWARLQPHLERVDLVLHETLTKQGKPIEYVYFPESGMISLVQTLADGTTIEVGLVGREGLAGAPVLLGASSSSAEAMVQGAGAALRIRAATLAAEADRSPTLRKKLLKYVQLLHTQVMQTAVCNGRHTLQQRLARWLLEALDRIGPGKLRISHEFLAYMLGTRRSGVTEALGGLKRLGVLAISRGTLDVQNRGALEAEACECYRMVQTEARRLGN